MTKKPPNPIDKFVGNRVRTARVLANMSQEKLGDALGITFQQVQKYEKGVNRIGSSRMQQIATILEKPVSWFFDEQNADKRQETDLIGQMLVLPGGKKLAESFLAIKSTHVRHVAAEVVHELARAG
jgi:transcriptional regulator with XRE-family HTH domain